MLDCDVMDKLQHFVESIAAIISAQEAPRAPPAKPCALPHPAVAAATTVKWSRPGDSVDGVPEQEEFPPPFPDLTRDEEKARFPPPYESTGASYWAFTPDIPPATAAQHHLNTSAAQPFPGVGAYDIQRSERATFQQSAGHSFRKAGMAADSQASPRTPSSTSTPSKPCVYKSSLARPVSPAVRVENASSRSEQTQDDGDKDGGEVMAWGDPGVRRVDKSTSAAELQADSVDDDDDERLEVDILNALRRQHSMVVSDFMQNIVLQHSEPPVYSSSANASPERAPHRKAASAAAAAAAAAARSKWRSSSESRFVSRMRTSRAWPPVESRPESLKTQNSSGTARPHSARSKPSKFPSSPAKSPSKRSNRSRAAANAKLPLPNGREPPTDEHLAWAARISDLYRAQQSLTS